MSKHVQLQTFVIQTDKGQSVFGEYEGNLESETAVIFVHGFGVKRDSYGMFNDVGDGLKRDVLVVRFDLVKVDNKEPSTTILPLSIQAEMLDAVIAYVRNKLKCKDIQIVSHSQGSIIVGLLQPKEISQIILLAAPIESPYERVQSYFSLQEHSKINLEGESKIQRSDGSWTYIDQSYWSEIKSIKPGKLYTQLRSFSTVYFIQAKNDQIIGDEDPSQMKAAFSEKFILVAGDHNFRGQARKGLKKVLYLLVIKNCS